MTPRPACRSCAWTPASTPGPVYATVPVEIGPRDTAAALATRLAAVGAQALLGTLAALGRGAAVATPQPAAGASYARKLDKAEALIDWRCAADALDRQVRAFEPWPVAETRFRGAQLRIHAAEPVAGAAGAPPGTVLAAGAAGVDVATGAGRLRLLRAAARRARRGQRRRVRRERGAPRAARRRAAAAVRRERRPASRAAAVRAVAEVHRRRPHARGRARDGGRGAGRPGARAGARVRHAALRAPPRARRRGAAGAAVGEPGARGAGAAARRPLPARVRRARRRTPPSAPRSPRRARVGAARAAGLVNACLRRFQRERAALLARADTTLGGRSSHPDWLVSALKRDWPAEAWQILEAGNEHPPLVLRANARRGIDRGAGRGAGRGRASRPGRCRSRRARSCSSARSTCASCRRSSPGAARCRMRPRSSPRRCSPRGRASACSTPAPRPAARPCHVLEEVAGLAELVALDLDAGRAARIGDNLARLGLEASVRVGDALDPATLAGEPFDRILIDAPCSGTGVIRRHPDIKWLRRREDLAPLAARQRAPAGCPVAAAGPRRAAPLRHLLGAQGRERRRGRRLPGRHPRGGRRHGIC